MNLNHLLSKTGAVSERLTVFSLMLAMISSGAAFLLLAAEASNLPRNAMG